MYRSPTPEATLLADALKKLGLRVMVEVFDDYKHIDISLPDARLNIEVDGGQHLLDPYQLLSDISRAHFSDLKGYNTIHVHNQEIRKNLGGIASAIAEAAKIIEERLHKKIVEVTES